MKRYFWLARLGLLLAFGVFLGSISAQAGDVPLPLPGGAMGAGPVYAGTLPGAADVYGTATAPYGPYGPYAGPNSYNPSPGNPGYDAPPAPLPPMPHGKQPMRDLVRWSLNLGCAGSHNSLGCTNLGSDLTFGFGSCRDFYKEPCFR
jgi:hypothetical protein